MFIEGLESRRLLSASLNTTTGLLTVTGTANSDHIALYQTRDGKLVVSETTFVPGANGQPPTVTHKNTSFTLTAVKSILVNADKGNDFVDVSGGYFHPLSIASTLNGGDGNDFLIGGGGKDAINGGMGNDRIFGGRGDDILHGNEGRDYVVGGLGADQLFGDAGNDYLNAVDRASTDKVDGGANDTPTATQPGDIAIVDKGDSVTGVEKVHTVMPPIV